MTTTKKVGRPKKFNRDDALMAAVNIFWAKGYDGASMKDLTLGMGINGPSLYAEFGDKRGLYLQAIDKYVNNGASAPLVALEQEDDIEKAVGAFFLAAIDYSTKHQGGARGCFLASCVSTSAGEVEGARELLKKAVEATDTRIAERFEREKRRGNLPTDFPSKERARLLFDLRQGLVFRARAGLPGESLVENIEDRVQMILDC
ncbi:MAG: TetR/AcrR family transcriptional regulator [Rhodospirillales bacterium]|nr:TetR/AcrR family transcriptional regulator [Rhodospirillales bacterium]